MAIGEEHKLRFDGVDFDQLERVAYQGDYRDKLDLTSIHSRPEPEHVRLPPSQVIILKQSRTTYEDEALNDLANSIASNGQTNPTTVAWLKSDASCQAYIEGLNRDKGTNYSVGEFPILPNEDGTYLIVIAGHQRTLGNIVKNYRQSGEGIQNPDAELMPCMVYEDIDFDTAFDIQITENACRVNPPLWEEAFTYARDYKRKREKGEAKTVSDAARKIGISDDKLRHAIRFTELPPQVHAYVIGDHAIFSEFPGEFDPLPYRTAVEIAKLSEHLDAVEITQVALIAMREDWTMRQAIREIDKIISMRRLPQNVQNCIAEGGLSLDCAPYFAKLNGVYGEDAILDFVLRYSSSGWTLGQLQSETQKMLQNAEYQQFSLQVEDTGATTALTQRGRSMNDARRFKEALWTLRNVVMTATGETVRGYDGQVVSEDDALKAFTEVLQLAEYLVGIGKVDQGMRARAAGALALVAAARTDMSAADVVRLTGGTINLEPVERPFEPVRPQPVEETLFS